MILIDNYDSFTYNIVQYLLELGVKPLVFENDKITADELSAINFKSIIISPGPGRPDNAGISIDVIKNFYEKKKILGICLGHQCIAEVFDGKTVKSRTPFHGKTSEIYIDETSKLFKGIPKKFKVTRYHSLEVTDLPECLKVTAVTKGRTIMALEHKNLPVYGVQFHPEAILSEYGHKLIENFIRI